MSWAAFMMLKEPQAIASLLECCRSKRFAESFGKRRREFATPEEFKQAAEGYFLSLLEPDWLEAFAGHPKIGDLASLKKKFAGDEQGQVAQASEATLQNLAMLNEEYEKRFGFIFIVCATGKSADQMLEILRNRLQNDRKQELVNAAQEQAKILRIRLDKLL